MSKYLLSNSSIYIDGTNIPKNKFNITDAKFLTTLEKNLLDESYMKYSSELNSKTILNKTYFMNLHKKTFKSLYDFAGVYRDVNMSKGESQFCLAQCLHGESSRIFKELAGDNYLADAKDDKALFAKKLAYYQGELIALHPFCELNGRITRLYCDMLALFNGFKPIDYSHAIDNGAYIDASIACVQYGDVSLLEKIIYEGLGR